MAGIQILAAAVAAGQLPGVCARHGEQGERTPVRLVSRPPDWAYPLAIIGVVIFVIVVVPDPQGGRRAGLAPMPAVSRRDRVRVLLVSLGILLAGVVGFFAGASLRAKDRAPDGCPSRSA